jgi:hypothetical protein
MVESTVLLWTFESADGRNQSYHLASKWLYRGQLNNVRPHGVLPPISPVHAARIQTSCQKIKWHPSINQRFRARSRGEICPILRSIPELFAS